MIHPIQVVAILAAFALLCLGIMLIARPAEAQEPVSIVPACVPYAVALALIQRSGGRILGEVAMPYAKNGMVLMFEADGGVYASGIAGDHLCVYSPSTAVGPIIKGTPA
jgi:hypothetical protein